MVAMKKFQVNIEQDHAKTEEPLRYGKRNTMQVTFKFKKNLDLDLKKRANQAMMVLMLIMQLLKVIVQVLIEQQPSLVK